MNKQRLFKKAGSGLLAALAGLLLSGLPAQASAPSRLATARYWVKLRDKNGVSFNPKKYFTPQARARRQRQHLPAYEASDLPVRADYLRQIQVQVETVTLVSRWFNAVACRATAAQAEALRQLPGVQSVELWAYRESTVAPVASRLLDRPAQRPGPLSANDYLLARRQTAHLDEPVLRRARLDGRGLRIAIFDVGFSGLPEHPGLRQLVDGRRIVATYDFLRHRPDVFQGGSHGLEVIGCLAGRLPAGPGGEVGLALGLASGAEFLLARTEQLHRERYAEEEAWLAAAEWADRQGADIINSSLAYTEQRYFPEHMNGRCSLIARAANLAARKGMLVVSAAGNDGDTDWVRIGTPADADSVLAVGGLEPETGLHCLFSSYGPTADRRPKPNVAAFGIVITTTPRGYERLEGTSFSSPLVAGFAACVWQQHREWTAMQLFEHLQQSAELYPYFDYAHGYGRPRAAHFLSSPPTAVLASPTFEFVVHDSLVAVVIRPDAAVQLARRLPLMAEQPDGGTVAEGTPAQPGTAGSELASPQPVGQEQPRSEPVPLLPDPDYPAYLFWSQADRNGVLRRYETRAVVQRLVVQVPRRLLQPGDVLRVHYKGYTGTYSE